jgi:hypothetical protein
LTSLFFFFFKRKENNNQEKKEKKASQGCQIHGFYICLPFFFVFPTLSQQKVLFLSFSWKIKIREKSIRQRYDHSGRNDGFLSWFPFSNFQFFFSFSFLPQGQLEGKKRKEI